MQLGTHFRSILAIAGPVMVFGLLHNVVSLIDTAFMGRVGEVELGAVGLGTILYFTLAMVAYGMGTGLQILIARRLGEGQGPREIGHIVHTGLFITLLAGVGMFVLVWALVPLLPYTLASPRVAAAVGDYLLWRSPEVFIFSTVVVLRSFSTGIGQTKVMAYSALVMTAANFGLNYLLVFGQFGFPAMGIGGAGLATALGEGLGLAVYLGFLWRNGHLGEYQLLRPRAPDYPLARTILRLSLPSILQGVVSMASFYLFFLAVERMGEHDLAVTQLVRNLFVLLMVPTWGLSAATNAIISNLIGQGLKEQVLPTLRRIIFISWGFWVVIAVPLLVFPHAVMQVYTPDVRLMADALPAVYFVVFVLLLFQPAWLSLSAVQGTGATRMALYFELSTLVFYLGYIWIATSFFTVGVLEVWYAEAVYDIGLLVTCQVYLRYGAWRKLVV